MASSMNFALPAFTGVSRQVGSAAFYALRVTAQWFRRHQDRRLLTAMDDHQLRDIGLTRDVVVRESLKPFWER